MNPWGFLVILLGIVIMIIGVKGTQHGVIAAITGKSVTATTPASGGAATA